MEPQTLAVDNHEKAPLVGWTSISPSLTSTPNKNNNRSFNNLNGCLKPTENQAKDDSKLNNSCLKLTNGNNKLTNGNNKLSGSCTMLDVPEAEVRFLDKDSIMSSSMTSMDARDRDDEDEEATKPKMPDGGWGWMVVLASLILSMIADGISFSFGLLYIEFLEEFGASKSATAWIGSLFLSVPLVTGPIMSALVDRYGCRKMTMLGGLISASGFVMSAYAQSIAVMYITFGVIAGLGLGLCYVTAVVSIAYWFDKKRNLAVGLGACGTGIGTFVYAPMTQYFIEEFGWRGTTLLLAGTFLNMCVCGALMRDPDWIIEQNKQNSLGGKSSKKTSSTHSVSGKSLFDDFPDVEEVRKLLKSENTNNEFQLQSLITSLQQYPGMEGKTAKELHRSDLDLPTFIKQNERVPLEVLEQLSANKRLYNVILENYPSLLACRSVSDKGLNKIAEDANAITARVPVTLAMKIKKADKVNKTKKKSIVHQQSLPEPAHHEPLLQRKTSLYQPITRSDSLPWFKKNFGLQNHNHFMNIRMHRNSVMYRGAMLNIKKYRLRASSCPDIYRNSMTTLAKEAQDKWYTEWVEMIEDIMDFSMFLELHFLLMSLSTMLLFIWFIIPYFYLAEHLTRHRYTESEASFVLSVIGMTNTIGMVALGWAGDQPWMNVTKTFSVSLILCGFSCIAMLFFTHNFALLSVFAGLFGLFFASSFVFTPVILVELIPLERFTTAYGLILLCQGIGNLIGPPLAGLLFDLTQTWEQSFIQAGIWIVVSGILLIFIPYTKNRKIIGSGPLENDMINCSDKGSMA